MRIIFTTILLTLNFIGFCQEHSSLFERDIIKENKVYKILEYNPVDSLNYFKKYPNGIYSNYDIYGRIVESNHYSPFEIDNKWISGEFRNHYLYDSLDNKIGFIQIHDNMASPFKFIELKSIDKENNKVKTVSLESSWKLNSNFIFDEKNLKEEKQIRTDTIVLNDFHKQIYFEGDSINYLDLYINENKLVDSTIYHSSCFGWIGKHDCETKVMYEYFANGAIKRKTEQHFEILEDKKLYSQYDYVYSQNGLLDCMTSYYKGNERKEMSKFKYYYREY